MRKFVSGNVGVATAALVAFLVPASVSADEMALTFVNHDLLVVGEFTGFENNAYLVQTASGTVITVPMDMVTCVGADCVATTGEDA